MGHSKIALDSVLIFNAKMTSLIAAEKETK